MEVDDSEISLPELKSDLVLEKKAGLSEKKEKDIQSLRERKNGVKCKY